MGMSASQARFLSITARMHDLEYQAQAIEYSKLSLSNDSYIAYEEYCEGVNATKYQMNVFSTEGADTKVDVTYSSIIASANQPTHIMYMLTDTATDAIYLPEQIVNGMNGKIPESLDEFLGIVADKYIYSGQGLTSDEAFDKLSQDGYSTYWTAIYYQLTGYTSDTGKVSTGRGFISVSTESANDREWIQRKIEEGEAILNVMQNAQDEVNDKKVNIFEKTNMATDTNMSIASDDLLISQAQDTYERKLEDINQKDKQLDLRLARIENERNALKTEYDTVKDLIKKNIERGYKTFNA